jgi:DedD protein
MAFFKFRKGSDDKAAPPPKSESIEAMRQRAVHRLIGAAVLVLAGVIGFPMLFDSQPRPIAVDIPIEIPDKNKARAATTAPVAEAPAAPAVAKADDIITEMKDERPAPKSEEKVASAPVKSTDDAAKNIAKQEPKPAPKPDTKPDTKPPASASVDAKALDAAKAQALLDGTAAPASSRFVVQVAAFADASRANEARSKLEQAGLKTYTQVVETKDGPRTRVRVGPFTDKAEADRVASKIKALALTATVLTL